MPIVPEPAPAVLGLGSSHAAMGVVKLLVGVSGGTVGDGVKGPHGISSAYCCALKRFKGGGTRCRCGLHTDVVVARPIPKALLPPSWPGPPAVRGRCGTAWMLRVGAGSGQFGLSIIAGVVGAEAPPPKTLSLLGNKGLANGAAKSLRRMPPSEFEPQGCSCAWPGRSCCCCGLGGGCSA